MTVSFAAASFRADRVGRGRPVQPAVVALLVVCLAVPASAQPQAPDRAAQAEAMDAVGFLAGNWEGDGWIRMGPQRSEFAGSERVRPAAGGLALVVEGIYRAEQPDGTQKVVHDALGMLTWDSAAQSYRFATKLETGFGGDYSARLLDEHSLEWSIPVPGREMRYVIRVEGDEWTETGRMTTDGGETWSDFFAMTLRRTDGS